MPPSSGSSSARQCFREILHFKPLHLPRRPVNPSNTSHVVQSNPSSSPVLFEFLLNSVKEVYLPLFKGIRTGAYKGGKERLTTRNSNLSIPRIRSIPLSRSTRPRIIPYGGVRAGATNLGLGLARNFNSTPIARVLDSVPFAIRALGQVGVDDRLWRNQVSVLRHEYRKNEKMNRMRTEKERIRGVDRGVEFNEYFGQEVEEDVLKVVLTLSMEPVLECEEEFMTESVGVMESYRVLSAETYSHLLYVRASYSKHATEIRRLSNRILAAGVFDPSSNTTCHFIIDSEGRKTVEIGFYNEWSLESVQKLLGITTAGVEDWLTLTEILPPDLYAQEDSIQFILPRPSSTTSTSSSSIDLESCESSPWGSFERTESDYEAGVRAFVEELDGFENRNSSL